MCNEITTRYSVNTDFRGGVFNFRFSIPDFRMIDTLCGLVLKRCCHRKSEIEDQKLDELNSKV
jgi:hypothetical protein